MINNYKEALWDGFAFKDFGMPVQSRSTWAVKQNFSVSHLKKPMAVMLIANFLLDKFRDGEI